MEKVERKTKSLIMDLQKVLDELRALREEVMELQRQHPQHAVKKERCKGVTGKGAPCCNGAVLGTEFCRMHTNMVPKPVKVPKPAKMPKLKKVQPEHNHGIGEVGENCQLCLMHGDVVDPNLPNMKFCGDLEKFRTFMEEEGDEYISDLEEGEEEQYKFDKNLDNCEIEEEDEVDDEMLRNLLMKQGDEDDDNGLNERLRMLLELEEDSFSEPEA